MVMWFMMKPMMHLWIWNPLKLIFSEPKITLLNSISHFKNHIFGIRKLSNHNFHIPIWSYRAMSTLFESEFLIIWTMYFLEKWQLANKFFASKVNCDGNTLLSAKKELKNSFFFLNQPCTCYKVRSCKLIIVSNILKAKESPCVTFES